MILAWESTCFDSMFELGPGWKRMFGRVVDFQANTVDGYELKARMQTLRRPLADLS